MKRILSVFLIAAMLLTFAACVPDGKENTTGDVPETSGSAATDTKATEPEGTEPEATEPEGTEPEGTEPEATEPEGTEPEATEPEATEPEGTEPEGTEPEGTEPEATEPEGTEPEGTEPEDTKPEGGDEIITPAPEMSEEEWAALFVFENVQIDSFADGEPMGTYLLDGALAAISYMGENQFITRDELPPMDFSEDFAAFREKGDGVFVAPSMTFFEADAEDVTVCVEDGKISRISYVLDFGMGVFMELSYRFSRYGEVSLELSEEEAEGLGAAALLEAYFESDLFENYSARISKTHTDGTVWERELDFDGAVYRETSREINGSFVHESLPMVVGSHGAGERLMENAAWLLYVMLDPATVSAVGETDAQNGTYAVTVPVEYYPEGCDYAIARNITFTLENARLSALSYDTEYYVFDGEDFEGEGTLVLRFRSDEEYYGYGENRIETVPMPSGTLDAALALLEKDAMRDVTYYTAEFFLGEAENYVARLSYYDRDTYDMEVDCYGEEVGGRGLTGEQEVLEPMYAFVDYLSSLDPSSFILRNGISDTACYIGETEFEYCVPEMLTVCYSEMSVRFDFVSPELEIYLEVMIY